MTQDFAWFNTESHRSFNISQRNNGELFVISSCTGVAATAFTMPASKVVELLQFAQLATSYVEMLDAQRGSTTFDAVMAPVRKSMAPAPETKSSLTELEEREVYKTRERHGSVQLAGGEMVAFLAPLIATSVTISQTSNVGDTSTETSVSFDLQ